MFTLEYKDLHWLRRKHQDKNQFLIYVELHISPQSPLQPVFAPFPILSCQTPLFSAISRLSPVSHSWNILLFSFPPNMHIHAFLKSHVSMGSYIIASYNTKILRCTQFKSIVQLEFWHKKGSWNYTLQQLRVLQSVPSYCLEDTWSSYCHTFNTTLKAIGSEKSCSWTEAPSLRLLALQHPETVFLL